MSVMKKSVGRSVATFDRSVATFLETTSMKGVPRLVRAPRFTLRMLWLIAVFGGTAIAAYFTTNLFKNYFNRDATVTQRQQANASSLFPSLTLCNMNPLGNMGPLEEFVNNYISSSYTKWSVSDELPTDDIDTAAQILSPTGMFEIIYQYDSIGNSSNFIVTCGWTSTGAGTSNETACMDYLKREVYTSSYGNCFTFNIPNNYQPGTIVGFSAIIFIDNFLEVNYPFFNLGTSGVLGAGAIIAVHPQNTLPDFSHSPTVPVGSNSFHYILGITVVTDTITNSDCREANSFNHYGNIYTQESCKILCLQNHVITRCNCTDGNQLSVAGLRNGTGFCGFAGDIVVENIYQRYVQQTTCRDHTVADKHVHCG